MKAAIQNAKAPFGKGKFSKVKNVRYLSWEDAFDVEFEDGLCLLEPHATIRKANKIPSRAKFDHLEIDDWCRAGFYVHYDNGQTAEVSWSFIRELSPKSSLHRK
ncbi:MAG: hypothetical protein ACLQSR_05125 [Limisphaerales bacterium]